LSDEVSSTLIALTERYQKYKNGFANWGGPAGEFYVEQEGIVALALAEALVQDYDGLIRIAPAVSRAWDFEGTVWVRNRTRVDVQTRAGVPDTVVIDAGASETLAIRNPWPGKPVEVVDANGRTAVRSTGSIVKLSVRQGKSYLLRPTGSATPAFASISGEASQQPKNLGIVQIGK
jgi:hypothetical protein